jgi:hypothetical protein
MTLVIPATALVAHVFAWAPGTDREWLHLELAGDAALHQARQIIAENPSHYVLVMTGGSTILFEEGEIPGPLAASDFAAWRASASKSAPGGMA